MNFVLVSSELGVRYKHKLPIMCVAEGIERSAVANNLKLSTCRNIHPTFYEAVSIPRWHDNIQIMNGRVVNTFVE